MTLVKPLALGVFALALASPAFAFDIKGYDQGNKCDVTLKGDYTLETLKTRLKEGDKVTIVDGCDGKTYVVQIHEVNRFEKLNSISYRLDLWDLRRTDNRRQRSVEMNPKDNPPD